MTTTQATTRPDAAGRRLPPRGSDGRFVSITSRDDEVPEDLSDPDLYLNRELSWLEFDRRVLAQATDGAVPLLERLRFVSIFHTNLDEFFMVRVAGLRRRARAGVRRRTADGRTPAEQLDAISARVRPLLAAATDVVADQLLPLLAASGVHVVGPDALDDEQCAWLDAFFDDEVFPVLTPLAVDPGRPFPYISNLSVSFAVSLHDPDAGADLFARVKVPGVLPRFVRVPGDGNVHVPLERVVAGRLGRLFPGMQVRDAHLFRVTRDADLDLEEDEADDLLGAIEAELRRRRFGPVVRLEVSHDMPAATRGLLLDEMGVDDSQVYDVRGLLRLGDLSELADLDLPELRYRPWTPVVPPRLERREQRPLPPVWPVADEPPPVDEADRGVDVFAEIRRGDQIGRAHV